MTYFGSKISQHMSKTPEGYLICSAVPIGRSGVIKYLDSELGIGNDGKIISVYRRPEENKSPITLASFEGKPVTDGHPDVDVDATNYNYYQKGHMQNIKADNNFIYADLFITDEALINDILSGNKREVSCGYDTTYKELNGNLYQTAIRGNHLAVVSEGRAGSQVSIRDDAEKIKKILQKRSNTQMRDVKKIIADFKRRVADAQTAEEVDLLTAQAEDEINGLMQNEPPVNPSQPVKDNPMAGDLGGENPMDKVMAAISALNAKVDSLVTGKPQSDGTPEGDIDKTIMELEQPAPAAPTNGLQEEGLTNDEDVINEDDKGVTSNNAPTQLEDVTSVDNKELEPSFTIEENEQVAKDAAIKILRDAKPIIASLKSADEKRKMTDAILKSVKDIMGKKSVKNKNDMGNVLNAANRKTADAKVLDEKAIENAYLKQNPHMAKKYNIGA